MANYNAGAVDTYGYNPVPGVYRGCLVEVGRFAPNAWGLYDLHGNAWEMVWDNYGDYLPGTHVDPRGPQTGTSGINGTDSSAKDSMNKRIIRGGSYCNQPVYLRASHRGVIAPDDSSYNDIGFRLVRDF
jgi:formylglycine-generating enzyme required for sulfatase activity